MGERKRPDIQALRALAVCLVVAFHIRPAWVPGGFVGVDIFFVISGFLITGSLTSEALRSGRIQLRAFWARRVRRLMPAATVVLAVALIGMTALLPLSTWPTVIQQVAASALSVQNWALVAQSVDYLQLGAAPTPVQHFWSLSVEEQFYVMWPLLLALGLLVSRRLARAPLALWRALTVVLGLGFLAWSIIETSTSPATAYFSTATRAWELLLGACLVFWTPQRRLHQRGASVTVILGIVFIAASVVLISPASPFPGAIALLPTFGAALFIAGGSGAAPVKPIANLMSWRPVTWVGDISYSLYLWHWPIIVFLVALTPASVDLPPTLAVLAIALSFALAALSWRFVEQPFQRPRSLTGASLQRTAILGGSLLAITGLLVGGASLNFGRIVHDIDVETDPRNFPGGRVLDPNYDASAWNDVTVAPIPTIGQRLTFEPQLTLECLSLDKDPKITTCEAGDTTSDTVVFLVGDSHAGQWLGALDEEGKVHHWKIIFAGKQYCSMSNRTEFFSLDKPLARYEECVEWNSSIAGYVQKLHPDLVVAGALDYGYPNWMDPRDHVDYDQLVSHGYSGAWKPIIDAGIPVVAIKEVPRFRDTATVCMERSGATIEGCSETLESLTSDGPSWLQLATEQEPRAGLIDMNSGLCPDGVCRPVIGNVYTYRDDSHVSDPYSRSLAWLFDAQLRPLHPELYG